MDKRTLIAVSLSALTLANTVAAENTPADASKSQKPPASTKKDPSQDAGARKLSRKERKERRAKLSDKYQKFLIDVEPIMMPDELDGFLVLESDAQRDLFIEEFWRRRDPNPHSSVNAYREDYGELLEEARSKYKNTMVDPSRMLLLHGRPNDVVKVSCDKYLQPIEIWKYAFIPGVGHNVLLLFYVPRNQQILKLWSTLMGDKDAMSDLLSPDGQMLGVERVFFESAGMGTGFISKIAEECKDGDQILNAMAWMQRNKSDVNALFTPPKIDTEDVGKILRSAVLANPDAPKLDVTFASAFPGKRGSRTDAELTLTVKKSQLTVKELEGAKFYNLDVTGEVLKDGKMFENYRYRYDFPAEAVGDAIPLVIERFLRPADYMSRIKVVDANSNAEAIVEQSLSVPEVADSAERVAATQEGSDAVSRLADEFRSGESRLRIAPLGNDALTGLQHIETLVTGDRIKAVEFYLDGRKVMTKRQPPYVLDLDFGTVPQPHRVRAVGLDEKGALVTGDELVANAGTDPFRVQIVSPRIANKLQGRVRVEIEASVPEGKELDHVELFLNETRLATMYSPPFVQTIDVPPNAGIGYLRAVAVMKGENAQPTEDVVFINTPEYMEEVNVHLVELPVTVVSSGKVLTTLTQNDFKVLDEGKPSKITKFEYVKNLPLSIGMAVDTSASMRPRMDEAQKAGAEFFKNVMHPGDKAFVVAFDTEPAVVQKWSPKLADLNAGLSKLRAEEATALYDAIVLSLYNFVGVKGQRALVVISDGKDTASKFSFEQALEYARRAAVPIYVVGIGIRTTEVDTRFKIGRFASETGGAVYYIETARDLGRIYGSIQEELRSQYVLGIYPPEGVKPGSKWREVAVQVAQGKVKTIKGYYP